jgi:hypothetical protein
MLVLWSIASRTPLFSFIYFRMSFPFPLSQPRHVQAKILSKREVADYFWGEGGGEERRGGTKSICFTKEAYVWSKSICVKHVRVSKDIYSAYPKLPLEKLAKKENNPLSICCPPTDVPCVGGWINFFIKKAKVPTTHTHTSQCFVTAESWIVWGHGAETESWPNPFSFIYIFFEKSIGVIENLSVWTRPLFH